MVVNLSNQSDIYHRSETLVRFYDDVKKFDTLSKEEEDECFKIIRKSSDKKLVKQYKDKIAKHNQRLVIAIAKKYGTKDNLLDLINEGNLGLLDAIDKFNPKFEAKFATYAVWHIRRSINMFLINNDKLVRKSYNQQTYNKLNNIKNEFLQKYERLPSDEELIETLYERFNLKITDNSDLLDVQSISINNDCDEDEDYNPYITEFETHTSNENLIEKEIEETHTKSLVNRLLSKLPQREQTIIKMLYGVDCERIYKLEEVAVEVNLTTERTRQLAKLAMKKLMEFSQK